jgi:alkylhydroperoxidase/carboxymuconolactone decarboxylase family protein YurZ
VLRLGVGERGVNEIMAVAEHVASLCAAAEGLRLPIDIPESAAPSAPFAVRPVDPAALAGEAAAAMAEVASWAPASLGISHVPLIWRVLARLPWMMLNTWRKDRLVMSGGRIDEDAKVCIAFAVACFKQSPYLIAYTTAQLRRSLGLDDEAVVELVASVMHYISFNTISHAMLLEPAHTDMRAVDFAAT